MLEGSSHKKELSAEEATITERYQQVLKAATDTNYAQIMELLGNFQSTQSPLPPKPPLTCIAIQGGGMKGGVYSGVMQTLYQTGHLNDVEYIGGASAGAITSFIIGLGFNGEQFKYVSDRINFLDFNDLKPEGWGAYFGGYKIGIGIDAARYGAAFSGDAFHRWASFLVEQVLGDPNATFRDLHDKRKTDPSLKDMLFKATRYQAKEGEPIEQTFSYVDTPDVRIADAVRASMAFPVAFSPWPVRNKEGDVIGIFADGGILNNLPIDVFNSKAFYDEKYLPIERLDHHGKRHQINPCSIGLSLTSLEELDDTITPMTEREKGIQQQEIAKKARKTPPDQVIEKEVSKLKQEWSYFDIVTAVWWNKIGVAVREQMLEKQKLYFDQIVQIWPENVGTLEFNAPKRKLELMEASGSNAMKLWLEQFRDPTAIYDYSKGFEDRLSQDERHLKKHDLPQFFRYKLIEYFLEFNKEMEKVSKQGNLSDEYVSKNVRLRYLTFRINKLVHQIEDKHGINAEEMVKEAFNDACAIFNQRNVEIAQNTEKRWDCLKQDKLVKLISEKFVDKPDEAIRMLQGQLSTVIPLVCLKVKKDNLLGLSVQTGNEILVDQIFKIVSNAITQCYFQGREKEVKHSLSDMLNEIASPPVFETAAKLKSTQMTKLLLQHGADPLFFNKKTGRNGLEEMILHGNYASFVIMVTACLEQDSDFENYSFGNQSLLHYILKNANMDFIKSLTEDKQTLQSIFNIDLLDDDGNNVEDLAARLSDSRNDLKWKLVATKDTIHKFEKRKHKAQKRHEMRQAEKVLAEKLYHSLETVNFDSSVVSSLTAQTCLDILTLPVDSSILLCTLAQEPSKVEFLKLLCEKSFSDDNTSDRLMNLLEKKWNGKTPLYLAAKAGNNAFVAFLRQPQYDMNVNYAGPIQAPCALLEAVKAGHFETAKVIMDSNPNTRYARGLRGYQPLEYDKKDASGRNVLHYLAMHGTPQMFCSILYGTNTPSNIVTALDLEGKSPLTYLIEHDRKDILHAIIEQGKGKKQSYMRRSDYYFDDLFLWQDRPTEGFSDLAFARRANPKIYEILHTHLSANPTKRDNIHQKVDERVGEQLQKERDKKHTYFNDIGKLQLSTAMQNDISKVSPEVKKSPGKEKRSALLHMSKQGLSKSSQSQGVENTTHYKKSPKLPKIST